jgi:hypothetical protein
VNSVVAFSAPANAPPNLVIVNAGDPREGEADVVIVMYKPPPPRKRKK